jgi:hypothetical protein
MIEENIRESLSVLDVIRLRPDVRLVVDHDKLRVISAGLRLAFDSPQAGELAALLAAGTNTAEQIAIRRRASAAISPAETLAVLDRLFVRGFIDEEPDEEPQDRAGLLQLEAATRAAR